MFKNKKKKVIITSIVGIAVLLFIIFLVAIIKYLMPDTKASVYGDRCEVSADYPIKDDRKQAVEKFFDSYDKIKFSYQKRRNACCRYAEQWRA